MKNLTRAQRKKAMRSFKPGDLVTWGSGEIAHVVLEVTLDGVIVDSTSANYGRIQADGTRHMLVMYDGNMRRLEAYLRGIARGPVRKATT